MPYDKSKGVKKKPINPRYLLRETDGKKKLYDLLKKVGYVPQDEALKSLVNGIIRCWGILYEGHRGVGKTALPEALVEALNLRLFYLQCLPDTSSDHILFRWDKEAQAHHLTIAKENGTPLEKAIQTQFSKQYVQMGEVLAAFDYAATSEYPPVLLIDEIDKLGSDEEAVFLQILGRGYANIPKLRPDPRLGFLPELPQEKKFRSYPIIIVTSNNMREISSPLRSRLRFCVIEDYKLFKIILILGRRVPHAPAKIFNQTAKLIKGIESLTLKEKPALREFIELLETFVDFGINEITPEAIRDHADCVAKTQKDRKIYLEGAESLYIRFVIEEDREVDQIVFEVKRKLNQEKKAGAVFN